MEDLSFHQSINIIKKVFIYAGLWNPTEIWGLTHILHLIAVPGIFCVGYFIAMTLYLAHAETMVEVTEGLYLTLTMVSCIIRIINFIYKQKTIKIFLIDLQSPLIAPKTEAEINFCRSSIKTFSKLCLGFLVTTYSIIGAGCFSSALSGYKFLPFPAWYPYDWQNDHRHFWIAFTYQTLAASCSGVIHSLLDLGHGFLFLQVSIFYRLVSMRLQEIGQTRTKDGILVDRDNAIEDLKECIQMHQFVNKLAKCARNICTVTITTQFCISGIIICFIVFHLSVLSPIEDTGLYLFNAFYLGTMLTEVFLPCYYGQQISHESGLLLTAVYSSNWTEMSQKYKKLMLCYMECLKKPKIITAGGYFHVGLEAMVAVLQNAYSYFALLKSMRN